MGSAVNDAMSELGGSFGVAILGGILAFSYRSRIDQAVTEAGATLEGVPPQAIEAVRESLASATLLVNQLPEVLAAPARAVTGQAFVSGMGWALTAGAVVTAVGAVFAWKFFPARMAKVEE
jgi:hypothetical protein